MYQHRSRYWNLGTLTIRMNLAASHHPERVADVTLMVIDVSCLPPRSCIGLVLHSAFALRLPEWMREAARVD